jgi:hypothetical protein
VVAGALVIVPAFRLLIPDPSVLGTEGWPAPSCLVWAGVSEAFANGLGALGPRGAARHPDRPALGVALALLGALRPQAKRPFVLLRRARDRHGDPGQQRIAMFLGGLLAELLRRTWKTLANKLVVPVASGLIAGESLMAVAIVLLRDVAGWLPKG